MSAAVVTTPARRSSAAFWLFWAGETVSNLGSSFTLFALPLLVFKLTGSALNLGLATAAELLPYLLFGLIMGVWADRLDRKRLMIVLDVGQALVLSSIPAMFLLGRLTVWWIYGVSFLSTTLKIGFEAGQFAALPSLVSQDELVTANSRLQASFSTAQMLGPMLAGALLFLLPLPALLFIDAGSFLVSACTLSCIRCSFNQAERRERTSVRQDVTEGLRYVWQQPVLRAISLMTPLLNFLTITLTAQLALFASVVYHAAGWQISLFYAAAAGGFVLAALLAGPLRKRWAFGRVALGAFLAYGVLTVALAFTPWYWAALLLWAVIQGGEMLFNVVARSLRQSIVPNQLLGRVLSAAYCLGWSTMPLGALAGGALIAWVGKGQIALVYMGIGDLVLLIPIAFAFTALGKAERYLPTATATTLRATQPRLPAAPSLPALPPARHGEEATQWARLLQSVHQHCLHCQAALPVWANFCGACGTPQWHNSEALTDPRLQRIGKARSNDEHH
jgi:MFS family permease